MAPRKAKQGAGNQALRHLSAATAVAGGGKRGGCKSVAALVIMRRAAAVTTPVASSRCCFFYSGSRSAHALKSVEDSNNSTWRKCYLW